VKVSCSIDYVELENDEGLPVDGVCVTCSRCNHKTESFGIGSASVLRCFVLMREECPEDENNFYVAPDDES
jgi:hypothetical protein